MQHDSVASDGNSAAAYSFVFIIKLNIKINAIISTVFIWGLWDGKLAGCLLKGLAVKHSTRQILKSSTLDFLINNPLR